MNATITHIGFADESYWNIGRFRSLGLVTLKIDDLDNLSKEVHLLLQESKISEFKWKNLDGAKERLAAEKLCKFTIEKSVSGKLRIDVLIWDIKDTRHKIPNRDDIANLQQMYFHLFSNVMRARWPNNAIWRLHPDEHTALNWKTVQDKLNKKSVTAVIENSLFTGDKFIMSLRKEFGIEEIKPVKSEECPLIQIADLFAGLAVFSHERFKEYQKWLKNISPQKELWEENELSKLSGSTQKRFPVLKQFDEMCKQKKLGVSLRKNCGLRTPNPNNPINFWMYEPQHEEDKAPTKSKKI